MKEKEHIESQQSFFQKLFNCCFANNNEEYELKNEEEGEEKTFKEASLLYKVKKELENEFSIFPAGIIREDERNKIVFTKNGLINFIINLQNLDYEDIYNENNLIISKTHSSDITDKFPIIRCEIIQNKSYFKKIPTIQQIIDAMIKPELRKKWDNNLIEYKIIEKLNNNSEIIKTITNKQFDIIEEKEFYDKRIGLLNNGNYYFFSSSIPEYNDNISFDYDKGKNYLNVMVISEDREKIYFDFFNQIDINANLPDKFIEDNLPNKAIIFFEKYFEFLNIL